MDSFKKKRKEKKDLIRTESIFKDKKMLIFSFFLVILINSNKTCESTYVNKETFEFRGQTGIKKCLLKLFIFKI